MQKSVPPVNESNSHGIQIQTQSENFNISSEFLNKILACFFRASVKRVSNCPLVSRPRRVSEPPRPMQGKTDAKNENLEKVF